MTRKTPLCGTRSAYQRHLRLKEPTDEACRAANAAHDRALRTGPTRAVEAPAELTATERTAARLVVNQASSSTEARTVLQMLGLMPSPPPRTDT
ncbi:hypothetical protein [Streptomyces sp. NPDC102264]|uniref:hypothetical protein n=1 Tax=Streptomyces sp. NPDC102264 TaxID=3366149 RepID=UPI003819334E